MTRKGNVESVILLVIFIVSCLVCGYWLFWKLTYKDHTHDTTKLSPLAYAEEKTYPIEINIFTNKNKNGKGVFELKFNYYMDTETPIYNEETGKYEFKDLYSTGVQFEIDYEKAKKTTSNYMTNDFFIAEQTGGFLGFSDVKRWYKFGDAPYYYDCSNGDSFGAVSNLTSLSNFIIDVDGTICKLMQNGFVNTKESYGFGHYVYRKYDFVDFIRHMVSKVALSFENGTNSYFLDLSTWFNVDIMDENGVFDGKKGATEEDTYIACKVTKSENGFISSKQSLFGIFKNNKNYGNQTIDYWKSFANYTLTERDFAFTYVGDGKYTAELSDACVEYLKVFTNTKYHLEIDLDSNFLKNRDIDLIGLNKGFAKSLKISSLTITSDTEKEFIIYDIISNLQIENVIITNGGGQQ